MVSPTQIENVLRDAIIRISDETKVSCKDTMLVITTENDNTAHPIYIAQNSKMRKKLLFNEIYSGMMAGIVESKAREILSKSLSRVANEKDVNPSAIRIMVITEDNNADDIFYFVDVKHEDGKKDTSQHKLNEILKA